MAYSCTICGEIHHDRPAFAFLSPYYYHALSEADKETSATLSEDWCIIEHDIQKDHFISAVLRLPVIGADDEFETESGYPSARRTLYTTWTISAKTSKVVLFSVTSVTGSPAMPTPC